MDRRGQPGQGGSSAAVALGSGASLGYSCVVGFQVCLCGGPDSHCSARRELSHARREMGEEGDGVIIMVCWYLPRGDFGGLGMS